MNVLILGPNGSGKSVYAEKTAANLSTGALVYIATMIPYGEEGQARVEKHRKQRENMGFRTEEKPCIVSDMTASPDMTVLLEDVSNLLGNALFGSHPCGNEDSVYADIFKLCKSCRNSVLVSIDGFVPKPEYDEGTNCFIDELNRLNDRLSGFVDIVIKMSNGNPIFVKGDENALH